MRPSGEQAVTKSPANGDVLHFWYPDDERGVIDHVRLTWMTDVVLPSAPEPKSEWKVEHWELRFEGEWAHTGWHTSPRAPDVLIGHGWLTDETAARDALRAKLEQRRTSLLGRVARVEQQLAALPSQGVDEHRGVVWDDDRARRFGALLAQARERARLSQRQLAGKCGISHSTIARLEAGKAGSRGRPVRPLADTVYALARGVTVDNDGAFESGRLRSVYAEFMRTCGYLVGTFDPEATVTASIGMTSGSERVEEGRTE